MAKIKYKPGMLIGPHKLLLIERSAINTKMGTFKCEICDNTFVSNIYNVNSGNRRFCDYHSKLNAQNFGARQANNNKRKEAVYKTNGKIWPGQQYGHLTVIARTEETRNTKRIWLCKCDCGNPDLIKVRSDLLLNGHTQSCGCIGSLGEQKIAKILIQQGYCYESQKIFSDCLSNKNYPLKFDFYLPDYNCCIEYDGEQHFHDTSGWFSNYSFEELKIRDNIKTQYCKNKNIKLIRIPYTDYEKIDQKYIKEKING